MISIQVVSEFIFNNFENVTVSKGNTHFHARCALCGDSKKNKRKKRFHLDWKGGKPVFQCWNCGKAGSFIKLYALIKGIAEEEARREIFPKYDPEIAVKKLAPQDAIESHTTLLGMNLVAPQKAKSDLPTFNYILDDCASAKHPVDASAYPAWIKMLEDFRIEREIPEWIPLYYAWRGEYKGRIIIPVLEGDEIVYFQARRRFDNDDGIVKYKNPATEKARIILNRKSFDPEKSIIVTEGLIDAFMVGKQGTTMLGKELSKEFLNALLALTRKDVIIAFDNDEEGRKSFKKNLDMPFAYRRVKYFIMPKKFIDSKDINKVVIDHDIQDVYDFIVKNSHIKERCKMSLLGR